MKDGIIILYAQRKINRHCKFRQRYLMVCPPELIENTSVDVDHFYEVEGYLLTEKIETNNNVQVPECDVMC